MKTVTLFVVVLLAGSPTLPAQFSSGSSGTNGALNITTDTVLPLPVDGTFHYTTISVASNATLSFSAKSNNMPVYLLATGDVSISGRIDVSGGNSAGRIGGQGGPGGFEGGYGGDDPDIAPGSGHGPGGGRGGSDRVDSCFGYTYSAGSGSYSSASDSRWYVSTNHGDVYGSALLVPLVGGSGGGGTSGSPGSGGGGGGGAILIASSTRIDITGTIRADGGSGATLNNSSCGVGLAHLNPGSGGAIRLVAPVVGGIGLLSATGPVGPVSIGNHGRIRIDSIDRNSFNLSSTPFRSVGNYMVVFPSSRLDLINVAGTPISLGSGPVTIQLPNGSPTTQPVTVQASNFSASVTVQIAVSPQNGATVLYTTNLNNLAQNPAIGTVNVTVPVSTPVTVSAWTKVP